MKPILAVLTTILALSCSAHAEKPNILLIYADDLGYGDFGCFNLQSRIPTPQIAKLASQGTRFTNAHSSSGICTPSPCVPTIIKWPDIAKAGKINDALVSQIDFMATLAAALGHKLPDDAAEDSHNLLPLHRGEVDSVRDSHIQNTKENHYAIRHGDWLLIDVRSGYVPGANDAWENAITMRPK